MDLRDMIELFAAMSLSHVRFNLRALCVVVLHGLTYVSPLVQLWG